MAKFLPFVVEKSTPEYIFQTLITRSKGINEILIASVFNLIVSEGITKVRAVAKEMGDDLPLSKVYEELMIKYSSKRITNNIYQRIQSIAEYIDAHHRQELNDELKEYNCEDIMSFLLVMKLHDKVQDYLSISLDPLFDDRYEEILINLSKYGMFDNDGETRVFESKKDLCNYIIYYGLINPSGDIRPVKAVLKTNDTKTAGNKHDDIPDANVYYDPWSDHPTSSPPPSPSPEEDL